METELAVKLLLALVLGSAVGMERELSGKAAGWRDNLLICLGATLITVVSIHMAEKYSTGGSVDASRVAAQIVSGIGFLGAGAIIQARGSVRGLTTAATIWVMAGVGLAVGSGYYAAAIGATLLILVALVVFERLERRMEARRLEHHYQVRTGPGQSIQVLQDLWRELGVHPQNVAYERRPGGLDVDFDLQASTGTHEAFIQRLTHLEGVERVLQTGR